MEKLQEIEKLFEGYNKIAGGMNLPKLDVVNPALCIPQDVNAHYMDQQMLKNLTENIKKDNQLQSVPLVYKNKNDNYEIISGHHRIEAANKAKIENIIVMIANVKNKDEVVAKQLSHNALVGKDDEVLVQKLYESLKDIELKYYTGLQDTLDNIEFVSLNFKAGLFKEFSVTFIPEEVENYDKILEVIKDMNFTSKSTVRITSLEYYDNFAKIIREIKKVDNIKSNGVALMRALELAKERIVQIAEEKKGQKIDEKSI